MLLKNIKITKNGNVYKNQKKIGKIDYGYCYIQNITIDPEERGKGIGSYVYNHIEQKYLKEHCQDFGIELTSVPDAVHFWRKQGFVKTGYLTYGEITMRKMV